MQPLHLRAEGGRIPEMKRVVVADDNQVVMPNAGEIVWSSRDGMKDH